MVDERTDLDQPFYTPYDRTLPQGLLYWRVQVNDPANNHLTWSPTRSFSNDQPAIDLVNGAATAPAVGATVGGSTPFRWTAMNGASQYQIEIYRNNDATHSDANRVIQATTRVPAFVSPNFLPTSSSDYRWRVRWFDADGQPRPWSADAHFSVRSTTVTQTSPADNTYQPTTGCTSPGTPCRSRRTTSSTCATPTATGTRVVRPRPRPSPEHRSVTEPSTGGSARSTPTATRSR